MMIRVEFSLAVALYLVLTACSILILWMFMERKKMLTSVSSDKRFFWQCDICTYVYVDSKHSVISQCPRCTSYNRREEAAEPMRNATRNLRGSSAIKEKEIRYD